MWRGCDAREHLPRSDRPQQIAGWGWSGIFAAMFSGRVLRKKSDADDQSVFDHDLGQARA
jgi:hypothetical protein